MITNQPATVAIQIGNSDDKLTQAKWANFCTKLVALAEICGEVHFAGGAATDKPWQNYCVVVVVSTSDLFFQLRQGVVDLRIEHGQDSVAWLDGEASFI